MRKLPPLNALRALEAAGRHNSFTLAAAELNVTPGAVSRQIKQLEELFGQTLFERKAGTLEPTERCAQFAYLLSDVFSRIESGARQLVDLDSEYEISVSASMTFTLLWLVPRLTDFHDSHPAWRMRLSAALPPPRLSDGGETDVFIQLGDGTLTDLPFVRLLHNHLVPVCSPSLLKNGPPLAVPEDLRHHTLLHSILRPQHWPDWLQTIGASEVDAATGNIQGSSALCYQAAIEGQGIAMGQLTFVIDDIVAGRLVTPFKIIVEDDQAFNFIKGAHPWSQKLEDFAGWITAQAEAHEARVASLTKDYLRVPKQRLA